MIFIDVKVLRTCAYWLIFVVQIIMSATSYVPQIVKLIKEKDSKGVSFASWAMSLFDFASYQALLIFDNASIALHALNIIQMMQILTVMFLVKKYEPRKVEVL